MASRIVVVCCLLAVSGTAAAEVLEAVPAGFRVRTTLDLAAAPEEVFAALTERTGLWWHPDHTFGGDASRLYLEQRAGGIFGETLPDGGSVRHLDVLFFRPPTLLRLGGGLGPLQGMAVNGALTIALAPAGDGTRLELTYDVGGWAPGGLAALAGPVDGVLAQQMARLKLFVEE
jgi:uncharacterized protein YndB with AHSA1/START domain